jgi:hypothetical protein
VGARCRAGAHTSARVNRSAAHAWFAQSQGGSLLLSHNFEYSSNCARSCAVALSFSGVLAPMRCSRARETEHQAQPRSNHTGVPFALKHHMFDLSECFPAAYSRLVRA